MPSTQLTESTKSTKRSKNVAALGARAIELTLQESGSSGFGTLQIVWGVVESPFGSVFVARSGWGVCQLGWLVESTRAEQATLLMKRFPDAVISQDDQLVDELLLWPEAGQEQSAPVLKLHLCGTPFQLNVWEALLDIAPGETRTYGDLARQIDMPKAARAVGGAVGENPVGGLVPCHRIIRSDGMIGGFRWGSEQKRRLLKAEGILLKVG
jgi:AraC family transcriptional regulator of adaptative response/methylated-DNA-[protein]-cysteine methyltransferase